MGQYSSAADDTQNLATGNVTKGNVRIAESRSWRSSRSMSWMIRALCTYLSILTRIVPALFRTQREQAIAELALRQQLATYAQKRARPRLTPVDRAFWVALFRLWPRRKRTLLIVQPKTVVRWHREGFRLYWRSISKRGSGRPRITREVQDIIRTMATENPWRARRIQAELEKLGIRVSLATVTSDNGGARSYEITETRSAQWTSSLCRRRASSFSTSGSSSDMDVERSCISTLLHTRRQPGLFNNCVTSPPLPGQSD